MMIESLETRRLFSTPTLATANVTVTEGKSAFAAVTVSFAKKTTHLVKVTYTTKSNTAVSGADFVAQRGTLEIPVGKISGVIEIPILDNSTLTTTAKFYVDFLTAVHAYLPKSPFYSGVTVKPSETATGSLIDLSDNLSDTSGGTQYASGDTDLAASFASTSSFDLKSIVIPIQQSSGSAVVQLYSDSNSQPATLIGTLTAPTTFSTTLAPTTFTSTNGIPLTAGSTYWVVLSSPTGLFNWSFSSQITGDGTGSGFTGNWAYSATAGSSWFVNTANPLQMSVGVT